MRKKAYPWVSKKSAKIQKTEKEDTLMKNNTATEQKSPEAIAVRSTLEDILKQGPRTL